MKNIYKLGGMMTIITVLLMAFRFAPAEVSAHRSPEGCTGSGLGINLFANAPQVHIGDVISYTVGIYNGSGNGPVVCDASAITASVITPDGVNHQLTLTRTALSNGDSDSYSAVVTYTASTTDVKGDGTLVASAIDSGTIHQNDTDSQGGGNQEVNVTVIVSPVVVPAVIHVIKQVINTGGGTAVASDFILHLKIAGTDVDGSPHFGIETPGTAYSVVAGNYSISEDSTSTYASSFSGDCDTSGNIVLLAGDNKGCTVVNTFIAPVIPPVEPPEPPVTPPVVTPPTTSYSSGGGSYYHYVPPVVTLVTTIPVVQAATIAPSFPNSGFPPMNGNNYLGFVELIVALAFISISSVIFVKSI